MKRVGADSRSRHVSQSSYSASDGLAALLPPGFGKRLLTLGRSGTAVSAGVKFFGYDVIEHTLAESVCGRQGANEDDTPRMAPSAPFVLPHAAGSFDVIVLRAGISDAERATSAHPAEPQVLTELHRVMKQDGVLMLVVENAYSVERVAAAVRSWRRTWRGDAQDPNGLQARGAPRHVAFGPRSLARWLDLLRQSQLRPVEVRTMWTDFHRWRHLYPAGGGVPRSGASWQNSVVTWFTRGLVTVRKGHWVASGYVLLLRSRSSARARFPVAGVAARIVEGSGGDWDETRLTNLPGSRSVAFLAGEWFVKLPVTQSGRSGIGLQKNVFEMLAGTPAASLLPVPMEARSIEGVPYFTFRAVRATRHPTAAELVDALTRLAASATPRRLTDTDLWTRIQTDREPLIGLGAAQLIDYIEASAAQRFVTSGNVHGDLFLPNILCDDRLVIVDWEHYEPASPHFLDILSATITMLRWQRRERSDDPTLAALRQIVRAESQHPLLEYFAAYRHELPIAATVILYLLHHASWLHRKHTTLSDRTRAVLQRRFDYCLELLILEDARPARTR